ncbi:MAG: CubicO group peptidase (beta-lactamase class C family) [Cyclobacteriaceae bacterium]|jgi:CubicO group peptidase (beta-lactamase class C family)
MRQGLYFLMLCLVCACAQNTQATEESVLLKPQIDLVRQKATRFPDNTQVSVAIIKNGSVSFFGLHNKNNTVLSERNHQRVFEIGSISKVFTAALLAQCALDSKLQLDDPIAQYIDMHLKDNQQISFVQLANHTSGLPRLPTNFDPRENPSNPYKNYGEKELGNYLMSGISLSESSNDTYAYSNLGPGLLGYLICNIEGQTYEELLQHEVSSRYEMNHTSTDRSTVQEHLVKGLDEQGHMVPNWDLGILVGAGGILSSAEDLSKFALAHFDKANRQLALTRVSTHTINHISDVGLGWEIIKRRSGDIWYKHNGRNGGYTSAMIMDVNLKNGVIILSNLSGYSSQNSVVDDLSFDLMKSIQKP